MQISIYGRILILKKLTIREERTEAIMLIIPNYTECRDENGKFSEKKFNEAFDKILKRNKKIEIEVNKIIKEIIGQNKEQTWIEPYTWKTIKMPEDSED